jgi:hypothetical protein
MISGLQKDLNEKRARNQAGAGLLTVVTTLGLVLLMIQGTGYYRSRASSKFLGAEQSKLLAMQIAEAGVEVNIADMGKRKLRVTNATIDTVTYNHEPLGMGSYTSTLTTVAMGPGSDTVDLVSTGNVGRGSHSVRARLKLNKYLDTTKTPIMVVDFDTLLTYAPRSVPDYDTNTVVADPNSMPAVNATPAYTACIASAAKKCDICHLPGGDVTKANVINIAKPSIGTHISHHGDYVTTDGTCDLYKPHDVITVTYHMELDTVRTITDNTIYDTTLVIDTAVRVQVISWK